MKYVGIDIGGTNIIAGIVEKINGEYKVLKKDRCDTKVKEGEDICQKLKYLYEKLLTKADIHQNEINWVGVGVPGSVDRKKGIVGFSNNLNLQSWYLKDELEHILKKKVTIINDADAYALGEFVAGSIRKANNALVLTLGTGVGCGIILNGKLFSSANFSAGEVGHMVIEKDGKPCTCGRKGCFEAYASATGLVNLAKDELAKSTDLENEYIYIKSKGLKRMNAKIPFDAKKDGDKTGERIISKYIEYLGCGITNIVNIFQPDKICLGGGVSLEGEYLLKPLREYVDKHKYKVLPFENVKIVRARNCETAGIIGAVAAGEIYL